MPAALSGLMLLSWLAGPGAAPVQAGPFVPGAKAPVWSQPSPRVQAGLEAAVLAALQANKDRIVAVAADTPTDCKMVKQIDPQFRSRMPVATPDPNTKYHVRIVPVPSCETRP